MQAIESFKKDKKLYQRAFQIAWPSVLESFFVALAGVIDTLMVSSLGAYAVAAVGLTVQPKFIALSIFFSINTAVSALVARRRGAKDKKGANQVLVTAFILAMILNVIISVLFVAQADWLISLVGSNPETHKPAVEYFRIIIGGQVFNVISMVINAAQRGAGNTKIAFTTNLTSSIVNVIFNYILIFGHLGFPALGIRGAAIATVLGTIVAAIMSTLSLFKRDSIVNIPYIFKNKIRGAKKYLKSIYNLGITIFIENIAMRIGFMATSVTAANLGTNIFAAHNIAMQFLSISFSFGNGMQVAAVALTGRALGAEKPDLAYKYANVSQRIGFALSLGLSLIYIIFGEQLVALFSEEKEIIKIGALLMKFLSLVIILQISQIIYGGALRAGGDVRYALLVSIVAVALVRTAVTLISVHVFDMGIIGIWLGILADLFIRFILLRHRFKTGKWTKIEI